MKDFQADRLAVSDQHPVKPPVIHLASNHGDLGPPGPERRGEHAGREFGRGLLARVLAQAGGEADTTVRAEALQAERDEEIKALVEAVNGHARSLVLLTPELARRGLAAVLPGEEEFPYTVRVVSEITESNGSSSMASVCGTSLSLMDAGVPVKAPVAGVAMGLVKEADEFAVLTDILGDEDHLGDMDFKVAGTEDGITALQMDIKIQGITREIMDKALDQARDARLHILGEMNKVIDAPREEMSEWAPTIMTIKIDPDKIRDVIGKGGAVIRAITEETGASVDIENDGTVRIASVDGASGKEARRRIELITADVEVGRVYEGRVARLMDFGAFVTILPGKDGLVHISQISNERVEKVSDKLSEGDVVKVKVLEVDRQGRVRLSMKEVDDAA